MAEVRMISLFLCCVLACKTCTAMENAIYSIGKNCPFQNKTASIVVKENDDINLDFLYDCVELESLELTTDTIKCENKYLRIYLNSVANKSISLKTIHIALEAKHLEIVLYNLLLQSYQLEYVYVAGYLNKKDVIYDLFKGWDISKLQSVILRSILKMRLAKQNQFEVDIERVFSQNNIIEWLDLSNNHIQIISGNIIGTLPNLKYLDLSGNDFIYIDMRLSFMLLLSMHPNIKAVKISKDFDEMESSESRTAKDPNDCLEGNNTLSDVYKDQILFCKVMNCFLKREAKCTYLNEFQHHTGNFHHDCTTVYSVAPNLERLYISVPRNNLSFNKTKNILCLFPNKVKELATDVFIECGTADFFRQATIYGLERLNTLRLTGMKLRMQLEQMASYHLQSLTVLDVTDNFFSFDLSSNSSLFKLFPFLTELHLTRNNLSYIPEKYFSNAVALEKLDLSGNSLQKIYLELDNTVSLKSLHLENNKIKYLKKEFISNLKQKRTQNLDLYLLGNDLRCGCSDNGLNTIEFLQQTNQWNITIKGQHHLTCSDDEYIHDISNFDFAKKRKECFPPNYRLIYTIIGASLGMLLVLLCIGLVIAIKKRYCIKNFFYRNKYKFCSKTSQRSQEYLYDIFITCVEEDREFVYNLVKELEKESQFNVCYEVAYGKDVFITGDKIRQSIMGIVIISENSLPDRYWNYWVKDNKHLEITHKRKFFYIQHGDIDRSKADTIVREIIDARKPLIYPEIPSEYSTKAFRWPCCDRQQPNDKENFDKKVKDFHHRFKEKVHKYMSGKNHREG